MASFTADARGISASCGGLNHRDSGTLGRCDECAFPVFRHDERKTLHDITTSESGRERYVCWRRHTCDPQAVEAYATAKAQRLADGQIIKGATVIVVKGRKVAKDTVGVVFWIGDKGWGPQVGFRTSEGVKHFTAEANVRAVTDAG